MRKDLDVELENFDGVVDPATFEELISQLIQQPFASQSKVSKPLPVIQTVVSNTSFVEAMNFGLLTSPWNPASLNGLDCFSR